MTPSGNLMPEPPATRLPENDAAAAALAGGGDPAEVAAHFPQYSAAWADLADRAYAAGAVIESYAYARVGYHRGLDALRRNGWKGHGPVPWAHHANRGFLRCRVRRVRQSLRHALQGAAVHQRMRSTGAATAVRAEEERGTDRGCDPLRADAARQRRRAAGGAAFPGTFSLSA